MPHALIKSAVSLFLLLMLTACASTDDGTAPIEVDPEAPEIIDPQEFLEFLDDLNAGLTIGDPRDLNEIEQRLFDRLYRELHSLLNEVDTVDALPENEQMMVFNSTQELWATVVGREEDQVICRREHRVGTNFKRTTCMTVAELEARQRDVRKYLNQVWNGGSQLPRSN
ncbi:MAG: hypothetical protein AAGH65_01270 [Pseudomonadota bacterium]